VVFPATAQNSIGQTVTQRWGALTPVRIAPDPGYLSSVISSVRNPARNLRFTAVGYGTGEKFPIPGQQTGPADPSGSNTATFLIRYIADNLTYNALNPTNDVLRLSMNIAQDESGTCNGDSGGPIFYNDPTRGKVQVSWCRAATRSAGRRTPGPVSARSRASTSSPVEPSPAA